MGSTVILDLIGGVALLLWGLHMVHSGVVRAFGAELTAPAWESRFKTGFALFSRAHSSPRVCRAAPPPD
jgi:hypothetical protein